ncbi:MAG TPA: hypothetical protein VK116_12525, partial [Planctomycetota bacterium]|nr:hypothetical protein [Planctomycetota bacterium]
LLVDIRRKVRTTSSFEKDSQSKADWIQAINLAGLPLLVALIGFLRFYTRRRASVRYEREYLRSQGMET